MTDETPRGIEASTLRDRYRGTLVGVALGDALGAAFEGVPGPISEDAVDVHLADPRPVHHTDDTMLTIATAESILYSGGLDEDHLAACCVDAFERDRSRGYGAGTAALLDALSRGGRWQDLAPAQFGGAGSFGNGAAMRVAPVALFAGSDPSLAAEMARRSARVTHTHPVGVEGAAILCAAVALTLADHDPAALPGALMTLCADAELGARLSAVAELAPTAGPGEVVEVTGTSVAASDSVPAAIAAFVLNADSFRDAVRFALRLGGDTDTIASMTGALAGARHGVESIPAAWRSRVPIEPRVTELGDRLAARALRNAR